MSSLDTRIRSFERKQILGAILLLVLMLGVSIALNYFIINNQAKQTTHLVSRMIHLRDFREVILTLQEARLSHFKTIAYTSSDSSHSFVLPEIAGLFPDRSLWHSIVFNKVRYNVETIQSESMGDTIVFEYNRFSMFPHALVVWMIFFLISLIQTKQMKRQIKNQYERDVLLKQQIAFSDLARTVRHNIRTPLAALMRLSGEIKYFKPEQNELMSGIISQIENLIHELEPTISPKHKANTESSFVETVRQSIQEAKLVIPQNVQLNTKIDEASSSIKTKFFVHELKAIVGNLINNSVEAISDTGKIDISVTDIGTHILLDIVDNGRGIQSEHLSLVTQKGFSYGKKAGSGIGLYHASENVKSWGGSLTISSTSRGTKVSISLPILERESWYSPRLRITKNDKIVIVDDQISIHRLWAIRLSEVGFTGKVEYFYSFDELRKHREFNIENITSHYFVDYDIGKDSDENGIDFLKSLNIYCSRYLVTGHYDELFIQDACKNNKLYLLPKTELADIPIVIV